MQVIQVVNPGAESRLEIGEIDTPVYGPDELLVRVRATAVNRADLMQRDGKYPPPPGASEILGLEMAGTVEAVGGSCADWKVGDKICGLLPGGGYAQYVVLPQSLAIRIPDEMPFKTAPFETAAAIPEVFLTAYQALYWLGEFAPGESVLIHAGGIGVGTAAIQLARRIRGVSAGRIFITASKTKHAVCRELGADVAIDYKSEDFATVVTEVTGGDGVNLVIDFIGAPYFEQNIAALGMDGRLVLLAMMGGSRLKDVSLSRLFSKRIHVKASTLRSRKLDYKAALTSDFVRDVMPALIDGSIGPVIDQVYDWKDVEAAHARMADNLNAGKIVMRVG